MLFIRHHQHLIILFFNFLIYWMSPKRSITTQVVTFHRRLIEKLLIVRAREKQLEVDTLTQGIIYEKTQSIYGDLLKQTPRYSTDEVSDPDWKELGSIPTQAVSIAAYSELEFISTQYKRQGENINLIDKYKWNRNMNSFYVIKLLVVTLVNNIPSEKTSLINVQKLFTLSSTHVHKFDICSKNLQNSFPHLAWRKCSSWKQDCIPSLLMW